MKGTVTFYDKDKSYGFITGEDGREVYVSSDAIKEGMKVTFDTIQTAKGQQAINVKKSR